MGAKNIIQNGPNSKIKKYFFFEGPNTKVEFLYIMYKRVLGTCTKLTETLHLLPIFYKLLNFTFDIAKLIMPWKEKQVYNKIIFKQ